MIMCRGIAIVQNGRVVMLSSHRRLDEVNFVAPGVIRLSPKVVHAYLIAITVCAISPPGHNNKQKIVKSIPRVIRRVPNLEGITFYPK